MRSEDTINDSTSDFTSKYFAVSYLYSLSETDPDIIEPETILTLERLIKKSKISHQRRSFFLFRQAAETLSSLIVRSHDRDIAELAFSALKNILNTTGGDSHRVAAESLGSLPFSVHGPELKDIPIKNVPRVSWQKVLDEKGFEIASPPEFIGRSFVAGLARNNGLLVFKFARSDDSPNALVREALWMEHLASGEYSFPPRFNIPAAIKIKNTYLFSLKGIPSATAGNKNLHPERYAIGFIADKDYFTYPNDSVPETRPGDTEFREVMFRNAWLLGKLTALGIIHSAPIPLFHNRVQRTRRRDQGLYEWFRAGRLDRWLESCAYPNLGPTGIRDFEHLVTFRGVSDRTLYRHIGNHVLSLLLVIGSYFRNKDKDKVGFDAEGEPVDARSLFDEHVLRESIRGVFLHYYQGFTGTDFSGEMPFDLDVLTSRMIEEMGVDRHMEEILRVADQNAMTAKEFRRFLEVRGFSDEEIKKFRKGAEEIVIQSGPHLGEFNRQISLPELIESVGTISALCIAGRYWKEKYLNI
ncbi:SidJ-related pseudokinase [Desulfonema magnum]|nr:SidJ-related pseudokinase [Desulfonema magnum]